MQTVLLWGGSHPNQEQQNLKRHVNNEAFSANAQATFYRAELDQANVTLSSIFKDKFNNITSLNDAYNIANEYGTHYLSGATFGANKGYTVYFDDQESSQNIARTMRDAKVVGKGLRGGKFQVNTFSKGRQRNKSCTKNCENMGDDIDPVPVKE